MDINNELFNFLRCAGRLGVFTLPA
jgi:hypothetical protein